MKITIQGELCDLNQYIKAHSNNRYAGGKIKKEETERCYWEAKRVKKEEFNFPVRITYIWYSKDKRKDIDNVAFSKKFINDGLTMAGILPDDSRKYISGFKDDFYIDKENPRTEIIIA